ncbi:MAG: hypothetical protein ACFFG0_00590 [Candidatus Thorarchaeota archaeon]
MKEKRTKEMKINLNEIAVEVANDEGGNREVDITQIKQVTSIFLKKLSVYSDEQILEVINRYRD